MTSLLPLVEDSYTSISTTTVPSLTAPISSLMDGDDFAGDTSTTGALTVGGAATGRIDFVGDRDFFEIELTAGEVVRVEINPALFFNGGISLEDEFGETLVFGTINRVNEPEFFIITPEESGTFFVVAESRSLELEYSITATLIEDDFAGDTSTTGTLMVDGTATGRIDFLGDDDFFAIDLTVGQVVRIVFDNPTDDASLLLLDSSGVTVGFSIRTDRTANELTLQFRADQTDTFFVVVTRKFWNNGLHLNSKLGAPHGRRFRR